MAKKFPDAVSDQRIAAIASLYQEGVSGGESVHTVAPDAISPNPFQPRKTISPTFLEELTASIREHGLLQPLLVRADQDFRFTLIAGHRRLEAARQLGLETVPVVIRPDVSDEDLKILALVENIQREELHAVDRLRAFVGLAETLGTYEKASAAVGMKTDAFKKWMQVRDLSSELLELCTQVPDLSFRMLQRLKALPENRRKAEVMRIIHAMQAEAAGPRFSESPGQPALETRPKSGNSKRFELRDDARRLSFVVEVRAKTKRKELTLHDYRDLLRRTLDEIEAQLAAEPPPTKPETDRFNG